MLDPTIVEAPDSIFSNRRCFPRRLPRGSATLIVDEKPAVAPIHITLRNISQSGIGFVAAKKLVPGQRIKISLQAPALLRPLILQAQVRWVGQDNEPGVFRIGCSWIERLSYAHIIHFA